MYSPTACMATVDIGSLLMHPQLQLYTLCCIASYVLCLPLRHGYASGTMQLLQHGCVIRKHLYMAASKDDMQHTNLVVFCTVVSSICQQDSENSQMALVTGKHQCCTTLQHMCSVPWTCLCCTLSKLLLQLMVESCKCTINSSVLLLHC